MNTAPTLNKEGRAPSFMQLAVYLLNEWVRELLEMDETRYQDDTLDRTYAVGGRLVQWLVPRRDATGKVESALVALEADLAEREQDADQRVAVQRAQSAAAWKARRAELQHELLQRIRSLPRDWGWVYWSAPRSLRTWADTEVRTSVADVQERAWHRVWIYLTLRTAALAELEQSELSAEQRQQLYLIGQINAPAEVDHREAESDTVFGGATSFVRGRGIRKADGRIVRKVNKKRSPARREQELAHARRKLAEAGTPEAKRAARKALARLEFKPSRGFRLDREGNAIPPRDVDEHGIVLPRALCSR